MNNDKNLESQLIQKQNRYIRQLEDQLAVYEEKDKAQEFLIENLNNALELFAEEITKLKAEKEKGDFREE